MLYNVKGKHVKCIEERDKDVAERRTLRMNRLKNRQLIKMEQKDDTYTFAVSILKSYIEDWEQVYFALISRPTNEEQVLEATTIKSSGDFNIYTFEIHFAKQAEFFQEAGEVDFSIVRKRSDEKQRGRIKSNFDYLEQRQLRLNDHVFYPVTTRAGNVSFFYKESFLLATCEHLELDKDGQLQLNGFYRWEKLADVTLKNITLTLTSTVHDDVYQIPVKTMSIPESYQEHDWYERVKDNGFTVQIDLLKYIELGDPQYFKFALTMEYEVAGQVETIESYRMKVNHQINRFPMKQKLPFQNKRMQIVVRPTKKSKYLSVRVAEYILPVEVARSAKRRWVSLRRSKLLLNLYTLAFFVLGKVLPRQKNFVIFESFHGKQYSDSPRAIYEYLKEHAPEYELVWSADRRHTDYFKAKHVPYIRRFSIRWLFAMTRAKYWVTNARLPLWIPKPRGTVYLQTWHGTPLKRLAADMDEVHMPGTNIEKYKANFTKEASKWDYLVSPNAYSSEIFRRAFRFNKEMIESGYPRNDYLFQADDPSFVEALKERLQLPQDKKIILYAPTWRDNQFYGRGRYKFGMELELDKLKEAFGETHIILLRMHYLVADQLDLTGYEDFVFDYSDHEDIRDLYVAADMLITDYSSVFFDYANLRRPMLFFVYDIDDYRDNLRGFYFDFEKSAPGPLVKTTEELISEMKKLETEGYDPDENAAFYERFCYLEDGEAAKRVVETVFKKK